MSQIFNRAPRQGSISPKTRLGTTWVVMTGMVALLVLPGLPWLQLSRLPQNQ